MKITYRGDYALKALFQLALRYGEPDRGGVLSINEIAKAGDMPMKFLEQILLILKKGGFVKSIRGREGGFVLAKAPKDITIGEVIRFIEGPIEPIACIEKENYRGCKDVKNCILRDVWKEVNSAVSNIIDTVTFEGLIDKYKNKKLNEKSVYEYVI